jgi:adenosylhomocysteinase
VSKFSGRLRLRVFRDLELVLTVSPAMLSNEVLPNTYLVSLVAIGGSTSRLDESRDLLTTIEYLPFTQLELTEIRSHLPLCGGISRPMGEHRLRNHGLFLTIHHMSDFVGMIEGLLHVGADPATMTVVDKEYPYLLTKRVDAHLKSQYGLRVFRFGNIEAGIRSHIQEANRMRRRSIIIDDGGYVLPVLLRSFPDSVHHFEGVVEQTTSGIRKLHEFPTLPIPVFSVAESKLKSSIESYGIAEAAIRSILGLLPHEKLEGQPALVIGYGRIGQEIASVLTARRMRVAVFDSALINLIAAHERGYLTDRCLERLIRLHRPLLIVGSAGKDSLTQSHFDSISRSCYLASVTSRNYEFRLAELRAISVDIRSEGKLGTRYTLSNGSHAIVLGDGFPINFHFAESLPNKYVDLVLAGLIVGACTLAGEDHGFGQGHNVAKTDQVLESSGILDSYYSLYGPQTERLEKGTQPRDSLTRAAD